MPLLRKLVLFIFIPFLSGCINSNESWNQQLGNAQNTSYTQNEAPSNVNNLKWTFKAENAINTSPVVSNGTVIIGSQGDYLYAIDELTGQIKWKYKGGDNLYSFVNPAIVNGLVLCSFDNSLHAVNIETGIVQWQFNTEESISTSPLIMDNLIIIGSYEEKLYAIDSSTGQEKWIIKTDPYFSYKPAVKDGVLYFASHGNYLKAYDIKSDKIKWENNDVLVATSPVIFDQKIYLGGSDGYLHAIEARSGKEIWKFKLFKKLVLGRPPIIDVSPVVSQDLVYATVRGENSKKLFAINRNTGQEEWIFKAEGDINTSPIVSKDILFVGSSDQFVYALNKKSGKQIYKFKTNNYIRESPVVANGKLFISSDFLYAVE